jgi:hypothetical protein
MIRESLNCDTSQSWNKPLAAATAAIKQPQSIRLRNVTESTLDNACECR